MSINLSGLNTAKRSAIAAAQQDVVGDSFRAVAPIVGKIDTAIRSSIAPLNARGVSIIRLEAFYTFILDVIDTLDISTGVIDSAALLGAVEASHNAAKEASANDKLLSDITHQSAVAQAIHSLVISNDTANRDKQIARLTILVDYLGAVLASFNRYQLGDTTGDIGDFTWLNGLATSAGSGNRASFYDATDGSEGVNNGSHVAGVTADEFPVGTVFRSAINDSALSVSDAPINDGYPGSEAGVNSSTFGIYLDPEQEDDLRAAYAHPAIFYKA